MNEVESHRDAYPVVDRVNDDGLRRGEEDITQPLDNGSPLYLYRSMRQDPDTGPEIGPGARSLGVRPGVGYGTDIPVDAEGRVHPRTGGLSVAPQSPMHLPDVRRPPEFWGRGKDPVWRIDTTKLMEGLVYRPDPKRPVTHGFIEPADTMRLEEFQALIAATGPEWTRVV